MPLDRGAPALAPIRALLQERHWRAFEAAVESAARGNTSDEGIEKHMREAQLGDADRVVLRMAFALWRGFGPAVEIQAFWGMDPGTASRVLAGFALAAGDERAEVLLRDATELLRANGEAGETNVAPIERATRRS